MVVEVFVKGSNFKWLCDTYWRVKTVQHDGSNLVLIFKEDESIFLNGDEYELRVSA